MVEDFTTYTENDTYSEITIDSATKVSWADLSRNEVNQNGVLYKDFGSGFFTAEDWEYEFEVYVSNLAGSGSVARINFGIYDSIALTNTSEITGNAQLWRIIYVSTTTWNTRITEVDGGSRYNSSGLGSNLNINTLYYGTFRRSSNTLYLEFYSDAARTSLVTSDSLALTDTSVTHQYFLLLGGWASTGSDDDVYVSSGYIQNLDLGYEYTADLKAGFNAQALNEELLGTFNVRQASSQNLHASFTSKQGYGNLLGEFAVQRSASQELKAGFDGQATLNLKAEFIVLVDSYTELKAGFNAQALNEELLATVFVRNAGSLDLLGETTIRHSSSAELLGEFKAVIPDSEELLAELITRRADSESLLAEFIVRHSASRELRAYFTGQVTLNLKAEFTIVVAPIGRNLRGQFIAAQGSQQLSAKLVSRQLTALDMVGKVKVSEQTVGVPLKAIFDISEGFGKLDLSAAFRVAQEIYNLPAGFTSRGISTSELKAGFQVVYHRDLYAKFQAGQETLNLPAKFDVGVGSVELKAEFISAQDSVELLAGFTSPYGEDYRDYTELEDTTDVITLAPKDPSNKLTVSGTTVITDLKARLIRELTTGYYFDDWPHSLNVEVDVEIGAFVEGAASDGDSAYAVVFALSESSNPIYTQWQNDEFVAILAGQYDDDRPYIVLMSYNDGYATEEDWSYLGSGESVRYLRLRYDPSVNANRVYLYIYTDKARTILDDTVYINWDSTKELKYIHAAGIWHANDSGHDDDGVTVEVSNLLVETLYDIYSTTLKAGFRVAQETLNLPAEFNAGQDSQDLKAGFSTNLVATSIDLLSKTKVNYGENYENYTEYDPTGIITLTVGNETNQLVIDGAFTDANRVAKLYRSCSPYNVSYGAGDYIEIQVDGYINLTTAVGNGDWIMGLLFAISDSPDDIYTQYNTAGYNFFGLAAGQYASGDYDFWIIGRSDDQGQDEDYVSAINIETQYYATVIRDPNVAPHRVYVYVYDDAERTNLVGSDNIYFSTDEPLVYIHAAGLWVEDPTELDNDEIELTVSNLRIFEHIEVTADLPAQFEVGQGSGDLKAQFYRGVDASTELKAQFKSAYPTSTNLPANFIVSRNGSANLLGNFKVRQLTNPYTIIVEDAWNTWLNYWERVGSGRISTPIRTDDIAEYYSGLNSHRIYTEDSSRGSETLVFGWSRTPYSNLRNPSSKTLPAELTVRHLDTFNLPASFTVLQGRENLKAEMKVTNKASVELKAGFKVAITDTQELLGQFTARQSTSRNLKAELYVQWLTGSEELLGEFNVRKSSSKNLKAEFYSLVPSVDLLAETTVRRSSSRELKASFDGQVTQNLHAEFTVRPSVSRDLLGAFKVKHSTTEIIIISENLGPWINRWERYGTGFLSLPVVEESVGTVIISMTYEENAEEALIFGWSQHPHRETTASRNRELKAGFDIS